MRGYRLLQGLSRPNKSAIGCRGIATLSRPVPVNLAYDKYEPSPSAKSGDPPLVIVHGMLGAKVNWKGLAKRVANDVGRDVYVIDQRNHGSSPHKPAMSLDALVSDLRHFIYDHRLHRVALLGHSLGGKVVMATALADPRLVERLVVEDAAPVAYRSVGEFERYIDKMAALDVSRYQTRQEVESAFVDVLPDLAKDRATLLFLSSNVINGPDGGYAWRCNLAAIKRHFGALVGWPEFKAPYGGPSLFLRAVKENYIRESHYPAIKELFPNSEIVDMQTRHWVHVEDPNAFIDAVDTFLRKPLDA